MAQRSCAMTLPALPAVEPKAYPCRSLTTVAISVLKVPSSSCRVVSRSTASEAASWRTCAASASGIFALVVRRLGAVGSTASPVELTCVTTCCVP